MAANAILLVEDSTADVYLIQRAAAECGRNIQLWTTADGAEALKFLRKDYPLAHVPTPALILLDLRLPTMSGTQILTAIRQLPAYDATPIIILSRVDKEKEEASCFQLGATAFVQKSTNFYVFFDSLKVLMRHWLKSESERDKEQAEREDK
jgi:CheY-like chemotaxis protein